MFATRLFSLGFVAAQIFLVYLTPCSATSTSHTDAESIATLVDEDFGVPLGKPRHFSGVQDQTFALGIPKFDPSLGNISSVQVVALVQGTPKWTIDWNVTEDCIGSGVEGVDYDFRGHAYVTLPNFGYDDGKADSDADYLPGDWQEDGVMPRHLADDMTYQSGFAKTIGTGYVGQYVGTGVVSGSIRLLSSYEMGADTDPVDSTYGNFSFTGIQQAAVEVIYTYEPTGSRGVLLSESHLVSATVPEPASVVLLLTAPLWIRKRNR